MQPDGNDVGSGGSAGTFTFAFLAIGLTTRFREFVAVGSKPFYAFTTGVVINIILGYVLSTQVFVDFWTKLGQ